MKNSIQTRSILLVLFVLALAIIGVTAYANRVLREQMTEQLGRQQFSTASYLADAIQQELQRRLGSLEKIALTITPAMLADGKRAQDFAELGVLRHDLFNGGLLLIRADGTVVGDSLPDTGRTGLNYLDVDTVAIALKDGQSNIGTPFPGKRIRNPVLGMAVPILDKNGRVIGALAGIINLALSNFIETLTNKANAQAEAYTLLVAPAKRLIITSSDSNRIMETLPPAGAIPSIDRFIDGAEGWSIVSSPKNVEVLAGVRRIPLTGWYVATLLPTQVALAPIEALSRTLWLGASVLALMLAICLIALFQHQFSPLRNAAGKLKAMRASGLAEALPIAKPDEVGELIGGFNQLLDDLTAREEALRNSEQKFALLFGKAAIPSVLLRLPEGSIEDVNDAWLNLFELQRDEAIGQAPLSRGAWQNQQCWRTIANRLETRQSFRDVEQCVHTRSGSSRTVLAHGERLTIDGKAYALVSLVDISDRLAAEELIRQILPAVEQNPNAIMIADRQGSLVYVNKAFETVTGYRSEEAIGRNPRFLQSGLTPPSTYRELWSALSQGTVWQGEIFNRRKNGDMYVEFSRIAPIVDGHGTTTHFVAITEDITEKKRLSAELDRHRHHLEQLVFERTMALDEANRALARHAASAESASEAKSSFLASMSHEIRTPMNAIIGLTHLAEQRATDDATRTYLYKIGMAAQHLLQIINGILDLSKIEAGKFELTDAEFNLARVFESTVTMLRERAESKGLALNYQIAPALAGTLIGDGLRMGQVLLNFAGNAVKFTESGQITLSASLVNEDADGLLIRCEVRDTGIGISPEAMARLFQPFEQASASAELAGSGTGLGLAISRRLAALMQGEAGAQSLPGEGSLFWFTARLRRGAPEAVPAFSEREAQTTVATLRQRFARTRVLIVDDEPINREISQELLQETFSAIDLAEDGLQAVAMAATDRYDLILMDMQLPALNGPEATRRIRQVAGYTHTPIIAMTANAFAEDRAHCLAAGMTDFVAKPFAPDHLFDIILSALEKATAIPCPLPSG